MSLPKKNGDAMDYGLAGIIITLILGFASVLMSIQSMYRSLHEEIQDVQSTLNNEIQELRRKMEYFTGLVEGTERTHSELSNIINSDIKQLQNQLHEIDKRITILEKSRR